MHTPLKSPTRPSGVNKQLQFNDAGIFGAAGVEYDKVAADLLVPFLRVGAGTKQLYNAWPTVPFVVRAANGDYPAAVIQLYSSTTVPEFAGVGLNDLAIDTPDGYAGIVARIFIIQIDFTGIIDTVKWSNNGGATWTPGTPIDAPIDLGYGITVSFAASTGHSLDESWTFAGNIGADPLTVLNQAGIPISSIIKADGNLGTNEKIYGVNNVMIAYLDYVGDNVCLGHTSGQSLINYGNNGFYNVLIGPDAQVEGPDITDSIAIGDHASVDASNQMVFGAACCWIDDIYFGGKLDKGNPVIHDVTLNATGRNGSAANSAGASIRLAGGKGCGYGTGGKVILSTAPAGAPDGGANPLVDQLIVFGDGKIVQGAPGAAVSDGDMLAGSISFYLNEAGSQLLVKVKYSDGVTIKTGSITLV